MPGELLLRLAAENQRRVCLVHGDRERTAGDLAEEARRVAGWLARHGIRRGERVMLIAANTARMSTNRVLPDLMDVFPPCQVVSFRA